MKIVFVLSHIPDPRINKRINILKDKYNISVIFWNRQTVDIWDICHDDIDIHEVRIKAYYSNPIKRIIPTCKFAIEAIRILKDLKPDLIYTGNLDMLSICNFYSRFNKKVKIIYEIADLNKLIIDKTKSIINNIIRRILVFTEKKLIKKVNLLVLTSEKFYDVYYYKFIEK